MKIGYYIHLGDKLDACNTEYINKYNINFIFNFCGSKNKGNAICYDYEIKDDEDQDLSETFKCVHAKVYEIIKNYPGSNIMLHCNRGMSRSPAILILLLMKMYNLTLHQAYKKVKTETQKYGRNINLNRGFKKQLMIYDELKYGKLTENFLGERKKYTGSYKHFF